MTGKAADLRNMVEQCLDDDPDERPTIQEVTRTIEPLKVSINFTFHSYLMHLAIAYNKMKELIMCSQCYCMHVL